MPALLRMAREPATNVPYLRTIMAHLTEIKLAQALLWIGVASVGAGLLRLRPWARVAMQVVGAGALLYFLGLLALWARAWSAPGIDPTVPQLSEGARLTMLAGGMTVFAALGGVVLFMVVVLRRPRIREAFDTRR